MTRKDITKGSSLSVGIQAVGYLYSPRVYMYLPCFVSIGVRNHYSINSCVILDESPRKGGADANSGLASRGHTGNSCCTGTIAYLSYITHSVAGRYYIMIIYRSLTTTGITII